MSHPMKGPAGVILTALIVAGAGPNGTPAEAGDVGSRFRRLESEVEEFDASMLVETSAGSFQVNQLVVDLFDSIPDATAQQIADAVGASIVGFDPATALYVLELPAAPADSGALDALNRAIDRIRVTFPDAVSVAFPNFLVGGGEAVDLDTLSASDRAAFESARIPEAWAFLPTALQANGKEAAERVNIGLLERGMESGDFGGSIAPHPEVDFGCDLPDSDCPLTAPDASDAIPISDQLMATHSASCGAGTACADERPNVDHGTFIAGVIGAVNNVGRSPAEPAALSNGVLAFANGGSGTSSSPGLSGGAVTGSDVPYQLLYNKTGALFGQMVTSMTELEAAGAQIIVLAFGWTLDSVACASDANPNRLTLDASSFANATTALRSAIASHPNILFVASAGNCGADAAQYHTPGGMSSPPANLVSVGATVPGSNDAAGFSNTGATVDVAAPGVGVPGPIGYHDQGPVISDATRAATASATSGTADVTTGTGTSGSAALTAGVAGLYLSVTGVLTESEVANLAGLLGESDVIPGTGLPGVPRLDALLLLQSLPSGVVPALPLWALALLGTGLLVAGGRSLRLARHPKPFQHAPDVDRRGELRQ